MNLLEWARQTVRILPSDTSAVTLTRADLRALVEGSGDGPFPAPSARDLTIEEVGEEVQRAASTVRGWLIAGELKGCKLNGRSWRVPRSALRACLEAQARKCEEPEDETPVDLSAWRRL